MAPLRLLGENRVLPKFGVWNRHRQIAPELQLATHVREDLEPVAACGSSKGSRPSALAISALLISP
jgi:hypothetical protein